MGVQSLDYEWTWMSGSSPGNAISVYGTPGTPAPAMFLEPELRSGQISSVIS